ncbi:MAG: DUF4097 family beta strand repeat protein [bacterium]|nr:MAG: DUF4097 family beta strand repeat protein [bacterium]
MNYFNLDVLKRNIRLCIFLFMIFLVLSCSRENGTEPLTLETYGMREFGGIKLSGEHVIHSQNSIGSIYIDGKVLDDTLLVYIYKTITAESKKLAQDHFSDIRLKHFSLNDTLYTSIDQVYHPKIEQYSCALFLTIPYQMECMIQNTKEKVSVSDLNSKLIVKDSNDEIEVIRHIGSCEVNTLEGNISIEVAIPDSGFCRGITACGDIFLKIPDTTSAKLSAYSHSGKVEYSNLTFANIIQKSDSLAGILEKGSGQIYLETNEGDIQIIGF